MSNEDGNEDRLTKNEFAELIQHLSVQEILAIEYRISTNWNKLFSRKNVAPHVFFCNLCALETSSFKNLIAHIDGKKHKFQMERVKQLYHADYTYPKNNKKEASSSAVNVDNKEKSHNIENNENKADNSNLEKNESADKLTTDNVQSEERSTEIETQNKTHQSYIAENKKAEEPAVSPPVSNNCETKNVEMGAQKRQDIKSKTTEEASKSKETTRVVTKTCDKRPIPENIELDSDLKKRKIVINPAAALALKQSSMKSKETKVGENSKKPQYQTDKIIIPTVHQNKSSNNKASPQADKQSDSKDAPKFTVKTYSSKPNENDVYGILGVEYVIKILKSRNDISPRYECGLCELVLDGFAMQRHLEGYNHRLKFCEKHFPTAIRHYRQYMQNVPESEIFKVMAPVLAKLAIAIEQHHGRNLPYECYERDFSLNRHEILAKAFSCRHASEQYGPTFTHVVGSEEIDEFINNRHKYVPPPFSRAAIFHTKSGGTSSNRPNNRHQNSGSAEKETNSRDRHRHAGREHIKASDTIYKSYMSSGLHEDMYPPSSIYQQPDNRNVQHVDDETYNLMVDDFLKGTLKGLPKRNTLSDKRKRSISPPRNSSLSKRKSLSPLRQNDIWQAYRHMVDQELYKLDERFQQYRKDPETHPSYNEEWQKFWKRRKDELVTAGLDHRNYNYQPEWIRFVKIRIEELYGQEVENIKIKSRERLCLPFSNEHISDVKYHVQAPKINLTNEISTGSYNSEPNIGFPTPSASLQPSNNTPQVVSVLRLMTALEDSLGSLGPKIIDLLSKALQTEKTNPLYVNALILNDDNCSLIETAKEKLKGMLITGLFEGSKKRVLNQVVNDAEALLQYVHQFKQQLVSQRSSFDRPQNNLSLSLDPVSANVSNTLQNQSGGSNLLVKKTQSTSSSLSSSITEQLTRVDKKELASKLAASLVAQGKTDFDPQQLQQLIAVYKLIEKKKRENKGPLQEPISYSRKALSDTLSDLLKPSSSSEYATTSDVSKAYNTSRSVSSSHSAPGSLNQKPSGTQYPSIGSSAFGNYVPPNSFTSVLQNTSGNYLQNTAAQSIANTFGASGGGGNQFQQRSDYNMNYPNNNLTANPQNSNLSNMYNNQYQNRNMMTQNWGWNMNTGMNQNYNVGGTNNNNFNKTSNWQNF